MDTLKQSNIREDYWEEHFNSHVPNGYNIGACGNVKPVSDEVRKKISKAKKGIPISEEHKRKISVANKGKKSDGNITVFI